MGSRAVLVAVGGVRGARSRRRRSLVPGVRVERGDVNLLSRYNNVARRWRLAAWCLARNAIGGVFSCRFYPTRQLR